MSLEERAFRKATRRLIPFLFFIYVVAYLDRVNVSFAQLQLEDDLDFSDTIFGLGAGIFSLGYVIFGVPSNLALARFGARRWLAAIMIVWGLISASMVFIEGPKSFYVLRFLLGAAEAGFFPGIILFLTWWFPERERTRTVALFLTAVAAAYVAGGPLSGGLLELDGVAGLEGWQWLFLVEGLPAIALGFVTLRYLDERPGDADWLEPEERAFLTEEVERERELREALGGQRVRDALGSGRVWLLGLIYFIVLAAAFGLTFFVPDLVQDRTGYTDFEVGVLSAVPYGFATVAMVIMSRRGGSLVVPVLVGAAGDRDHRLRRVAAPAHRGHYPGGRGSPVGTSALLGAAHGLPQRYRGGCRHRADRRRRKPRRLRGPGVHRDRRGPDGELQDAAGGAGRDAGGLQPARASASRGATRGAGGRVVNAATLSAQADQLRGLHVPGSPLLLVNAWDPPSARRLAHDGYPAIATTSAGVAEALGYEDGNVTPPDEMLAAVGRIAAVVDVPVTADLEAGYGLEPRELVEGLLRAGAVGLNFEDTDHDGGGMVDAESQVERLAAIKEAGRAAGVDVVLNARVDVFLHDAEPRPARGGRAPRPALRGGRRRLASIRSARAGATRSAASSRRSGRPLNMLVMPGGLTLAELGELGVARASFGSGLMHIAMDAAAEEASEYRATGPG